jgi:hypothetical protein
MDRCGAAQQHQNDGMRYLFMPLILCDEFPALRTAFKESAK